ncbi:MAG: hypothetical protein HZB51_13935 [Chloroflexi bacterium]|nr:hypothetical protein [Chloroflexota bacterium]
MKNNLFLGIWRHLFPVPSAIWQKQVAEKAERARAHLAFMSPDHHRVRNLVVRELPRVGKPLAPEWIVPELNLPLEKVVALLGELERHMTFLFRNGDGAVTWAYPVTVDQTPHRITLSTGERVFAA